ncbi:O-linked N-acetylglucosamine transferase [Siccirubricoccus sp. KC 17139]|uniref:O-linked N-acetylglucosamine transferase n=1 Tax=Siccirubricoccus soli TaxID=2899147 RepID=A0ABT1D0K2_9PROT|nr:O-linked N-acetylglucosamine transferase [Siccirubricoccus soli]MCO6415432.1 O-linked N-acetylglucosamine transferase [Siccirubricoccus soli]MCP2681564.1 O-linked N-acetylglucosamine transferase [Siccirubricoccus soli]
MPHVSLAELLATAQGFVQAGRPALAASLYRDWLAQSPETALRHIVCFNYALVLSQLGDIGGAAAALQEAIRLQPDFLPPFLAFGTLHERLGSTAQALGCWAHVANGLAAITGDAIQYKATALKQSARVLEDAKRLGEAEEMLRRIIELGQPPRDVVQHWLSLRQRQCRWPVVASVGGLDRAALIAAMAPLTAANYADDPLLHLAAAAAHSRLDSGQPKTLPFPLAPRPLGLGQRRLRIGYLSSDLRNHAIGYLMADMLRHHDRSGFEIFVYYCGIAAEDGIKQRIRGQAEHWVSITELDDEAACRRMREDGIDILVDINGHTRSARTRLLSLRPAPAIVNWLGYAGSMGSAYHHYIIADPVIIPPGSEHYYSEKVLRLPCYQPTDPQRVVADRMPSRAAAGLPEDATVFCCFNGPQKITPFVFRRWMEILRQVPGSVLWLLKGAEEVDTRLKAMAAAEGIAPERLVFAPLADNPSHLARYPLADLFLDTTPYGAHTTASDALWMGVPVLTQPGRSFASRVCASLVTAAGMPELVMGSAADYVAAATLLGRDRARLAALREKLLAGRETALLFDPARLVQAMEGLFRSIAADLAADAVPVPELTNLETYLEIAGELGHELVEFTGLPDYEARYRTALAARHAFAPLPADARLWPGGATLPLGAAA